MSRSNTKTVTQDTALLQVENLRVQFPAKHGSLQALRGVSFSLREGEILGLVGESGSGKSVTAHAILRLLPQNAVIDGRVCFRGTDVYTMDALEQRNFRGRNVAMIFQEPGQTFDPIYTIGHSLEETVRAHNPDMSDKEIRSKTIRLLEEVHISSAEERLQHFPHQLSGGLLQRVDIAHALANDPAVLIADEPTTALDVTIQAEIVHLLNELRQTRNLSIIFITHDLALISGFADNIAVMYSGLILETGTMQGILNHARHPYTAGLLAGCVPFGWHYSQHELHILSGVPPSPLQPEPGCPFAPRCPIRKDKCTQAIPPVVEENGIYHRCLVSGHKTLFQKDTVAR